MSTRRQGYCHFWQQALDWLAISLPHVSAVLLGPYMFDAGPSLSDRIDAVIAFEGVSFTLLYLIRAVFVRYELSVPKQLFVLAPPMILGGTSSYLKLLASRPIEYSWWGLGYVGCPTLLGFAVVITLVILNALINRTRSGRRGPETNRTGTMGG